MRNKLQANQFEAQQSGSSINDHLTPIEEDSHDNNEIKKNLTNNILFIILITIVMNHLPKLMKKYKKLMKHMDSM